MEKAPEPAVAFSSCVGGTPGANPISDDLTTGTR